MLTLPDTLRFTPVSSARKFNKTSFVTLQLMFIFTYLVIVHQPLNMKNVFTIKREMFYY